ncbi:hypothetical protein L3X37_06620 [Sabulilitoribacter arenilitoris]|uniref:Uncharacterized protein n=1 Tax=Wocania arenilitoris TaxID=2044858 RepID=A0AAE3ENC2_9FLAO|nr:hypothetical protein [Wocania arenilitoris]MCF7568038.1 hypothetical protein [Wocania arenilitoris]
MIYLLMPIHKEVRSTLHRISHFLEMPNTILSHNKYENINYNLTASAITYHEHKILDLLNNLTEANSKTNESNKPHVVISKIDKHFHLSKYGVLKLIETKSSLAIDCYKEKLKTLFYKKIKIPPKNISIQLS